MHIVIGVIYILLGICGYCYFLKKTRDFLNPFGMTMAVWLAVAGLAGNIPRRLSLQRE